MINEINATHRNLSGYIFLLFKNHSRTSELEVSHSGEKISINYNENLATVIVFLSAKCPCSDSNAGVVKELVKNTRVFHL